MTVSRGEEAAAGGATEPSRKKIGADQQSYCARWFLLFSRDGRVNLGWGEQMDVDRIIGVDRRSRFNFPTALRAFISSSRF
jgi:hypothetical protein